MSAHVPSRSRALFGKLPGQGDFVRAGALGPAQQAFASWLTAAVERSHGELPGEPVRFLFSLREDALFVGAWVASRDEVGRAFPLASLHEVPCDLAGLSWSLLPAFYASFLGALERCLCTGIDEGLAWLQHALTRLKEPHPSELPGVLHDAREHLTGLRVDQFAARSFASCSAVACSLEPLCYALDTLDRAAQLDGEALTLDLPARSAFDLYVWLALMQGSRPSAQAARAMLWTEQRGRALLCLGNPSEQLLVYLLNAHHKGAQRWPLWTESKEASAAAREALHPRIRSLLEHNASVRDLLAAHQLREG